MNLKEYYNTLYKNPKYDGVDPEVDPCAKLRFKLILKILKKYCKINKNSKVLNIGILWYFPEICSSKVK